MPVSPSLNLLEKVESSVSFGPINGDTHYLEIVFKTPEFEVIDGENGLFIELEGGVRTYKPGVPDLPFLVDSFEIPEGYAAQLEGVSLDEPTFIRGSVRYNEGVRKDLVPEDALVVETGYAGKRGFSRVVFRPFQYDEGHAKISQRSGATARVRLVPRELIDGALDVQVASTSSGQSAASEDLGGCGCSEPFLRAEESLPEMKGAPGDFSSRRAGAEVGAYIRIGVHETGLHKVTRAALLAGGACDADLVGSELRVFHLDREVAIIPSTQGLFGSSDYFLFYGRRFHGYDSDENVYWLGFGGSSLAMVSQNAAVGSQPGAVSVTSACLQQTFNDDKVFHPASNVSDASWNGWFFGTAFSTFVGVKTVLEHTDAALSSSPVSVDVRLRSNATLPGHSLFLRTPLMSSGVLASSAYSGNAYTVLSQTFSSSALTTDSQDMWFTVASSDVVFIDEARFSFDRTLEAFNGQLAFGGVAGASQYTVTKLTGAPPYWALDVSDPWEPVLLTNGTVSATGSGTFSLAFEAAETNDPCYQVTGDDHLIDVLGADISIHSFRNLSDVTRQADYLIIAPAAFSSSSAELLRHRAASGERVMLVTLEEVMNEFGYGLHDVRSIKQFVGYAFHHWQGSPPRYLALVGDGTYDPKKNIITQNTWIPTPMATTTFTYSSIDSWYGTVNGNDTLSDVMIGRFPVNSDAEMLQVLNKIKPYELAIVGSPSWASNALFVADNEFVGNAFGAGAVPTIPSTFRVSSDDIIAASFTDATWQVTTAYLNDGGQNMPGNVNASAVNSSIRNKVNAGTYLVHYEGHGAAEKWADEDVLNNFNVLNNLNNSVWPLVNVFTCNNGIFHEPDTGDCMMENLVRKNQKGAVGGLAPTALAVPDVSSIMAEEFYQCLVNDQETVGVSGASFIRAPALCKTFGEALRNAQTALWLLNGSSNDELLFYTLFGDPALRVKP